MEHVFLGNYSSRQSQKKKKNQSIIFLGQAGIWLSHLILPSPLPPERRNIFKFSC